jgi:hypothetical protein
MPFRKKSMITLKIKQKLQTQPVEKKLELPIPKARGIYSYHWILNGFCVIFSFPSAYVTVQSRAIGEPEWVLTSLSVRLSRHDCMQRKPVHVMLCYITYYGQGMLCDGTYCRHSTCDLSCKSYLNDSSEILNRNVILASL